MTDYGGFVNISYSNSFYFTNASNNDMLIYPETSNQSVHIGVTSNSTSMITVNSNTITLNASNLVVKGPITTNNNLTYAPVDYGVSNFSIPGAIVGNVPVSASNPFSTTTTADGSLYITTSNYVAIPNSIFNTKWNTGFTCEAWVNYPTFSNVGHSTYPNVPLSMGVFNDWSFGSTQSSNLGFYYYNTAAAMNYVTGSNQMQPNTWYHIAVTCDATNIRIFQNGILQNSAAVSGTPVNSYSIFNIGGPSGAGSGVANMYIASPRVTYGSALYTANFTPPTAPLTPSPTGTTALLLRAPQNPGRVLIPKIGGTTQVQAYPPAAMTANLTNIQNTAYGAGNYIANYSAVRGGDAYYVFNKNNSDYWQWTAPAATTVVDSAGTSYVCEYIQLQMPVSINISSYYVNGTNANWPTGWSILASTNGLVWDNINNQTGQNTSAGVTYNVNTSKAYNYYRFIYTASSGAYPVLAEWILYGTQESISITTDGQVGLGVTRPTQQLEVAGNAIINGNISANNLGMFRNRIINGDMKISQRGTTFTTGQASQYILDRWYYEYNNSMISTITQSTDTPLGLGLSYSINLTVTTGGSGSMYGGIYQYVEGFNAIDFMWGTSQGVPIILSFWTKLSIASNSIVNIEIDYYGTTTYAYYASYTIYNSNTWEFKTIVIPPPPVAAGAFSSANINKILAIRFMRNGSANTSPVTNGTWSTTINGYASGININLGNALTYSYLITGVQLEKGTFATPFEFRPYSIELELCQRYYWQQVTTFYVSALSAGDPNPRVWMNYPVPMRIAPTITGTSSATFTPASITTMGFSCGDFNKGAGAFGTINSIYATAEL